MPISYASGETITKGDRVLLNGNPGEIELVVDPNNAHAETDRYLEENPDGGILVREPKVFGRVFLSQQSVLEACERLEFVSRQED